MQTLESDYCSFPRAEKAASNSTTMTEMSACACMCTSEYRDLTSAFAQTHHLQMPPLASSTTCLRTDEAMLPPTARACSVLGLAVEGSMGCEHRIVLPSRFGYRDLDVVFPQSRTQCSSCIVGMPLHHSAAWLPSSQTRAALRPSK